MNKDLMRQAGYGEAVDRFESGLCSWCGVEINMDEFKDALSAKEYTISGYCQICQDSIFVEDYEDDW